MPVWIPVSFMANKCSCSRVFVLSCVRVLVCCVPVCSCPLVCSWFRVFVSSSVRDFVYSCPRVFVISCIRVLICSWFRVFVISCVRDLVCSCPRVFVISCVHVARESMRADCFLLLLSLAAAAAQDGLRPFALAPRCWRWVINRPASVSAGPMLHSLFAAALYA